MADAPTSLDWEYVTHGTRDIREPDGRNDGPGRLCGLAFSAAAFAAPPSIFGVTQALAELAAEAIRLLSACRAAVYRRWLSAFIHLSATPVEDASRSFTRRTETPQSLPAQLQQLPPQGSFFFRRHLTAVPLICAISTSISPAAVVAGDTVAAAPAGVVRALAHRMGRRPRCNKRQPAACLAAALLIFIAMVFIASTWAVAARSRPGRSTPPGRRADAGGTARAVVSLAHRLWLLPRGTARPISLAAGDVGAC